MPGCVHCGRPVRARGFRRCATCEPTDTTSKIVARWMLRAVTAGVATVMVVLAGITAQSWSQGRPVTSGFRPPVDVGAGSGADAGRGVLPRTPTQAPAVAPPTAAGPAAANAALNSQVSADRAAVEAVVDYWVPQLSSKRLGLVNGGTTYGYEEIWEDFIAIRSRFPDARLLWSADFTSFRYKDFWITIVATPYADGAAANSWCDSHAIGPDDCYAKRLSHSYGFDGSTLSRK